MTNSLPSFYRPDNRLNCPFPLSMIALSIAHNLIQFKRDREFFEQQYMAARFFREQFQAKVAEMYPDGAPEPEYPPERNSKILYGWIPGMNGSYFPPMIQSILHETTCDLRHRARVLFADAMEQAAKTHKVSSRFDVFLVWSVRALGNPMRDQATSRAEGIVNIENEIISGLLSDQTDVAGNIAHLIAGHIEDLERDEATA